MLFAESTAQDKQSFKYNGKELDQMHGLNQYDYSARYYDPGYSRFITIDPHAENYFSWLPYAYVGNNPLKFIDPDGKAASPIYDIDGDFLGTDDQGLKGYAIVMDKENFKQGMSHEKAKAFNRNTSGGEANDKIKTHYEGLPSRPDYDGKITLKEANEWYRNGNGEPLYVDAAKIDLSPVTTGDLELNKGVGINFASPGKANKETGLVYGTLTLTLTSKSMGTVKIGNLNTNKVDTYDFDQQKGRFFRNIATKIGETVAGKGVGYPIYGYGVGSVEVK